MHNVELLANSLDYIEKHLKDNFKTVDIADACYCSKSTLEKLFHYVYATSVHEYVIRRRMMQAAELIAAQPQRSILSVATEFGYSSHEAFARAFKDIWNCNPSEFRRKKFAELYPRFREPFQEGEEYVMQRKSVDISQLYNLFNERRACYFVCCDIKSLIPINDISRKAGDLAILEAMQRMNAAAGGEDVVFRIGGDEFCILTNSRDPAYAQQVADAIKAHNGETFAYGDRDIPLTLYVVITKFAGASLKYNELFSELHMAIKETK